MSQLASHTAGSTVSGFSTSNSLSTLNWNILSKEQTSSRPGWEDHAVFKTEFLFPCLMWPMKQQRGVENREHMGQTHQKETRCLSCSSGYFLLGRRLPAQPLPPCVHTPLITGNTQNRCGPSETLCNVAVSSSQGHCLCPHGDSNPVGNTGQVVTSAFSQLIGKKNDKHWGNNAYTLRDSNSQALLSSPV